MNENFEDSKKIENNEIYKSEYLENLTSKISERNTCINDLNNLNIEEVDTLKKIDQIKEKKELKESEYNKKYPKEDELAIREENSFIKMIADVFNKLKIVREMREQVTQKKQEEKEKLKDQIDNLNKEIEKFEKAVENINKEKTQKLLKISEKLMPEFLKQEKGVFFIDPVDNQKLYASKKDQKDKGSKIKGIDEEEHAIVYFVSKILDKDRKINTKKNIKLRLNYEDFQKEVEIAKRPLPILATIDSLPQYVNYSLDSYIIIDKLTKDNLNVSLEEMNKKFKILEEKDLNLSKDAIALAPLHMYEKELKSNDELSKQVIYFSEENGLDSIKNMMSIYTNKEPENLISDRILKDYEKRIDIDNAISLRDAAIEFVNDDKENNDLRKKDRFSLNEISDIVLLCSENKEKFNIPAPKLYSSLGIIKRDGCYFLQDYDDMVSNINMPSYKKSLDEEVTFEKARKVYNNNKIFTNESMDESKKILEDEVSKKDMNMEEFLKFSNIKNILRYQKLINQGHNALKGYKIVDCNDHIVLENEIPENITILDMVIKSKYNISNQTKAKEFVDASINSKTLKEQSLHLGFIDELSEKGKNNEHRDRC